jgi:hypothetical protein
MWAATKGHELAIKALLEGGADAGQSNPHVRNRVIRDDRVRGGGSCVYVLNLNAVNLQVGKVRGRLMVCESLKLEVAL